MELADWGNLEELPLNLIFNKLVELIDHISFSMVCKHWYSIAKFHYQNFQTKNNALPVLFQRFLYGISPETIYPFKVPISFNKRLCGSSQGWIASWDSDYGIVTLVNPFKIGVSISLPSIYKIPNITIWTRYSNVHKVILSSNPTDRPHDYVVAAIYGRNNILIFTKAGQKFWTSPNIALGFTDIIFYKDLVYALGLENNIMSFNICSSKDSFHHTNFVPYVVSSPGVDFARQTYFAKSLEGDLWLVKKLSNSTTKFIVYKLELNLQSSRFVPLIKLDSLGDNILFVGNSSDSVSMSVSCFANYLQKDSIFYANDHSKKGMDPCPSVEFDMEIYNVKDGSSTQHCRSQLCFTRMSPSLWILPPF